MRLHTLTCPDLNAIGCSDPDCTEDHDVLYLHPTCHRNAGTWARFDKNTGELTIECMECERSFVCIKVASV